VQEQPTTAAAAPDAPMLEPATAGPSQNLGGPSPGMIRVLLFHGADGITRAAHLEDVAGLEEVDLEAVDQGRGLWGILSGTDLLPLVAIYPAGSLPTAGRAPVIVFSVDRQSFGLLVDSVPEVADVAPQEPASTGRCEVVLRDGEAIHVIDPARYLDHAI